MLALKIGDDASDIEGVPRPLVELGQPGGTLCGTTSVYRGGVRRALLSLLMGGVVQLAGGYVVQSWEGALRRANVTDNWSVHHRERLPALD
jgi:hypothetical protein